MIDGAIEIETLAAYALRDAYAADDPHSMLGALIGERAFRSDDLVVANTVEVTFDATAVTNN